MAVIARNHRDMRRSQGIWTEIAEFDKAKLLHIGVIGYIALSTPSDTRNLLNAKIGDCVILACTLQTKFTFQPSRMVFGVALGCSLAVVVDLLG
jgi:hypothetical protein